MSLVIGEALIDIVTASSGATTEYVGGSRSTSRSVSAGSIVRSNSSPGSAATREAARSSGTSSSRE